MAIVTQATLDEMELDSVIYFGEEDVGKSNFLDHVTRHRLSESDRRDHITTRIEEIRGTTDRVTDR